MTEHCDLNHAPIGVFDSGVSGLTGDHASDTG